MDSKIVFKKEFDRLSRQYVDDVRVSFMILTATVSEIFGGQTNSSILVV